MSDTTERITAAEFRKKYASKPFVPKMKRSGKETFQIEVILVDQGIKFEKEFIFHPIRKWRFDFAILDQKVAIEYEGIISDKSRHTNIKGYTEDSNKYNEAQKLGWKVLRYTALNYTNIIEDLKEIM